jgi:para-nitrobenzyl esterase
MPTHEPIVRTESGLVRGAVRETPSGASVEYLGVPFASIAPADRFRRARPVEVWPGVRDARKPGPAAPQSVSPMSPPSGNDEADCLNLNIWTPPPGGDHRPVMVWIHGGAYVMGSNADPICSGADLAARSGVVVVAVNHRLGALGFLDLEHLLGPEFADSGNAAMLDLVDALTWVRRNAAAFGGDPGRVTVFGQSAGAAAVGTLLGMPAAAGLCGRAIMQSGTAERVHTRDASRGITADFLDAAGVRERDAERLLTASVPDLLVAQERLLAQVQLRTAGPATPFQPTLDGCVVPDVPLDAIRKGASSGVDLIAGTAAQEALAFGDVAGSPAAVAKALDRGIADQFPDAEGARRRYLDALRQDGRPASDAELLESLVTSQRYGSPTDRLLDARAESSAATYRYLFAWPSPSFDPPAAVHGLELSFVFGTLSTDIARPVVGEGAPAGLSETMASAWTAFAATGDPATPGFAWPAYGTDRLTAVFDTASSVVADPGGAVRRFWRSEQRHARGAGSEGEAADRDGGAVAWARESMGGNDIVRRVS